jgi:hypothetical protein
MTQREHLDAIERIDKTIDVGIKGSKTVNLRAYRKLKDDRAYHVRLLSALKKED